MTAAEPPPPRAVGWPPTRRAGDLLLVSGQLALDDDGQLVGGDDWGAQATQCLRRIEHELAGHGATMDDVVRLNSFLVDAAGYPAYAEARRRLYPGMAPAGTAVIVVGLLVPGALLEVEATALLDPRSVDRRGDERKGVHP